jgi:hypothetical protein
MPKPIKRVDLSKLTPEQRDAFIQFVKDCRAAAPQIEEFKQTMQQVFVEMVRAPRWSLHDAEGAPPPGLDELWHVGAPVVNYVDHIDIERPSDQ